MSSDLVECRPLCWNHRSTALTPSNLVVLQTSPTCRGSATQCLSIPRLNFALTQLCQTVMDLDNVTSRMPLHGMHDPRYQSQLATKRLRHEDDTQTACTAVHTTLTVAYGTQSAPKWPAHLIAKHAFTGPQGHWPCCGSG